MFSLRLELGSDNQACLRDFITPFLLEYAYSIGGLCSGSRGGGGGGGRDTNTGLLCETLGLDYKKEVIVGREKNEANLGLPKEEAPLEDQDCQRTAHVQQRSHQLR